MPKKLVPAVRVVAKTEIFRRAGFVFTREPQDLFEKDFKGEEGEKKLQMLRDEPMLFCTPVEVEVEDDSDDEKNAVDSGTTSSKAKK